MTYRRTTAPDSRPAGPVSRRDFLTMHTRGEQRILELACEPLYMRYVDAQSQVAAQQDAQKSSVGRADQRNLNHNDFGEPSTAFLQPTTQDLIDELEQHLQDADVLLVTGETWLSGNGFAQQIKACLDNFRQRGGQVEFS